MRTTPAAGNRGTRAQRAERRASRGEAAATCWVPHMQQAGKRGSPAAADLPTSCISGPSLVMHNACVLLACRTMQTCASGRSWIDLALGTCPVPGHAAGKQGAEAEAEAATEEAVDLPLLASAVAALMQQREFAGSCTLGGGCSAPAAVRDALAARHAPKGKPPARL